ncbi:hypothetical protein CRENBAI_013176 [Crenichthys baileyi]|uniref:Uncharacterized protein n=1 Tax=Crenichthys baileyi TaxID=28760 RepID=A0AAV9RTK8_9TELE
MEIITCNQVFLSIICLNGVEEPYMKLSAVSRTQSVYTDRTKVIGPAGEETSKVRTRTVLFQGSSWLLKQFLVHHMTPLLRNINPSQPSQDGKKEDQPIEDNNPPQTKDL